MSKNAFILVVEIRSSQRAGLKPRNTTKRPSRQVPRWSNLVWKMHRAAESSLPARSEPQGLPCSNYKLQTRDIFYDRHPSPIRFSHGVFAGAA